MSHPSPITTHVLDVARGRPASGVRVRLDKSDGHGWLPLAQSETDDDGRVRAWWPGPLHAATYRITFETGAYFAHHNVQGFYPEASVVFQVTDAGAHYHVPLLLSPFGYSTYRGS